MKITDISKILILGGAGMMVVCEGRSCYNVTHYYDEHYTNVVNWRVVTDGNNSYKLQRNSIVNGKWEDVCCEGNMEEVNRTLNWNLQYYNNQIQNKNKTWKEIK